MTSQPTLRQLRYLKALADTTHFRKAAELEGISQPSLSVQISNLEEILNLRLFERGRGPVTLTPAGREVLSRAQRVLDGVQSIIDLSSTLQSGLAGTIRLGASPTLGPYIMPYVVAELHKAFPDLRLYIRESAPRDLAADLQRGTHDVILTQLPVNGSDFQTERLFREPLRLTVPRDHPLADRSEVQREDLRDLPILSLGPAYSLHEQIAGLCHEFGANLLRDYEGTSLDALRQMVGMGLGATFLPALYIRSEIGEADKSVATIPFRRGTLNRSIGMVWRQSSGSHNAYHRIANTVRDVAAANFATVLQIEGA